MNRVLKCISVIIAGTAFSGVALCAPPPLGFFEDFRFNPLTNGWGSFGQPELFAWNSTNQNLEVTWDSSKSNSYFYKPIGRTLTRNDDFTFAFDLQMRDIAIGTTSNKPYTFQIAVALLKFQQATNGGFLRGTGFDSPNLFEFDYFPDSGFGATISPTVISSNHQFATLFILEEITTNDLFRIVMRRDPDEGNIRVSLTRNGTNFIGRRTFTLGSGFGDFSVDTLAITSYSDEGQHPDFAGSILAHGTIDNVYMSAARRLALDLGFTGRFENGNWRMEFDTKPGWLYFVYGSSNVIDVQNVIGEFDVIFGPYVSTNYGRAAVIHTNPPIDNPMFYRVYGGL